MKEKSDERSAILWVHRKYPRWSLKWTARKLMVLTVNGRTVEEYTLEKLTIWCWKKMPPPTLVHDEFPNRMKALDWFIDAMRLHDINYWKPPIPAPESPINPDMDKRDERSKKLRISMSAPQDF